MDNGYKIVDRFGPAVFRINCAIEIMTRDKVPLKDPSALFEMVSALDMMHAYDLAKTYYTSIVIICGKNSEISIKAQANLDQNKKPNPTLMKSPPRWTPSQKNCYDKEINNARGLLDKLMKLHKENSTYVQESDNTKL